MDEQGRRESVEILVEIPRGSRNKYEYDHDTDVIRLDRRLFSATVYPADYGFVPGTLGEDGDPLDAIVLLHDADYYSARGSWMRTAAALPPILAELESRGLKTVSLRRHCSRCRVRRSRREPCAGCAPC